MPVSGTKVQFEAVRLAAFGAIGASYTALGSATSAQARIVCITNTTNQDVYISIDGTADQIRVAANSFKLFDFTTNRNKDEGYFLVSGTTFYQKHAGVAPTSGNLWIEVVTTSGGS